MLTWVRKTFLKPLGGQRHFLAFLLCALILPSVAVVLVAVLGMLSQEKAMEAAVSSYVQDLAENMAYRLSRDTRLWSLPFNLLGDVSRYQSFFAWSPSIPGWVALIGVDGEVVMASPGAMNIAAIWRDNLPIGTATRITDKQGAEYTLAIHPLTQGEGYVIAAVSWDQLLGGLVKVVRMWPALIVLMTLGSFLAIRLMWSQLVQPLKSLVAEIDSLRVGKDVPNELTHGAVKEIESVHSALIRFSQAAVERDNLRNRYVRDIVRVQEKERMDMAREIHDGPLQDITALLQQIHMSLEDEVPQDRIKRTEALAKTVVRELRSLCDELAPPWMDLGLTETLTELAERQSQNYDIQVSVDIDGDPEVEPEATLSFMRIFQEAVSNAVRHGGATEVRAQVREEEGKLVLDIQDNGRGFDAHVDHEMLRLQGHRGLANMTERMSLMGGSLNVISEAGQGTRILAVLPLTVVRNVGNIKEEEESN